MKNNKIKIICTLGPSSFKKKVLSQLKKEKIDIFRINLSHTKKKDIEKTILYLKRNKLKNICIDTEGAQIRTTSVKKKIFLNKNNKVKIFNGSKSSSRSNIYFYPNFKILDLKKGTIINIGFNNLKIKVLTKDFSNRCLICNVEKKGLLESNKGVHINANFKLPALTDKDIFALNLAKKYGLKYFAISFVNNSNDINLVKNIVGNNSVIISKIETKNAVINLKKISDVSNALLIDRGDLSRYVPIEKIPVAQEMIIKNSLRFKIPTYVATNLLETMIKESEPTRAESHDIFSSLNQGCSGLVLAAETAIGSSPIECVRFLKRCIKNFLLIKKKKFTIINKMKYLLN
tara:strand:+ start:1816 stop:2853 length:1038 start_codon:yes stop_codon:yes gene_type:complete